MNRVILIGNLTRDPELQTTNSGLSICRFSLAVQRRFSNAEGQRGADFINITAFGKTGEICHKFLKKGSKCAVCGRIQVSTYEAQDGTKRTSTDIIADEVEFVGARNGDDGSSEQIGESASSKVVADLDPIDDDSLPF